MTVEFWIDEEFHTPHERHAVKRFLDDMCLRYGHHRDPYFVLANFRLVGRQIDLAVLKRDAVIVIELKQCSEPFLATENGDWLTLGTRRKIDGGNDVQNPYEQVASYHELMIDYLMKNQARFLSKSKLHTLNLAHVSAVVAISPSLHPGYQDEIRYVKWFSLVGLDQLPQEVYELTSRQLHFSEQELRKLIGILRLRRGTLETGGLWEPSERSGAGCAPPPPGLVLGREDDLSQLKARLGLGNAHTQPATAVVTTVKGWPGVGKTTLAAALAHDGDVLLAFHDGVLWTSLGDKPDIPAKLGEWVQAVNPSDSPNLATAEALSARLAALLRKQRRLLIIDDVWTAEHALPFRVGGRLCATLVTTRFDDVAQALAPYPDHVYKLAVLTDDQALELLRLLAPTVAQQYPEECLQLALCLEGLPLALQVAGRLLNTEASCGFTVLDLLSELAEGSRLLQEKAPADYTGTASQTTPTIAALLRKSTDILDSLGRDCFAFLGAFAPKPATFDLAAMASVWGTLDPKPIVRQLLRRGLIERSGGRYQMHALLAMHARSLAMEG